jgi:alpha-tubulin suppressor-like RCC1 family protein
MLIVGIMAAQIECGDHHTAVLDSDGLLFTWGWGGSFFSGAGCLGLGETALLLRIFCVRYSARMFLFGGLGDEATQPAPVLVVRTDSAALTET